MACFTSQHTAVSPKQGVKFESETFDLTQMVESILSLVKLLRRETLLPMGAGFYRSEEGDRSCVWLSHRTPLSAIIDSSLNISLGYTPLISDVQQLGLDLFLVPHRGRNEFLNKIQFLKMTQQLGLKLNLHWNEDVPESSFMTVKREEGGGLTLESFNPGRPSACILNEQGHTVQFMAGTMFEKLHHVWIKLQRVLKFYNYQPMCSGLGDISLEKLAGLSNAALDACIEEMRVKGGGREEKSKGGAAKERKKRGLLEFLFSDGRLNTVEKTLKASVSKYNKNLQRIAHFDNEVVRNFGKIEKTLGGIVDTEVELGHQIAALAHQLQSINGRQIFYDEKMSTLEMLRNIVEAGRLESNLGLLSRALMSNPLCTLESCEKSIQSNFQPGGQVVVTKQLLSLSSEDKLLIQCELAPNGWVPKLHNMDGGMTETGSLLIGSKILGMEDLGNKSFIEAELKMIPEEELLLGALHHFRRGGTTVVQCPRMITFQLDGKTIQCEHLQKITLPTNFRLEYLGRVLTAQHLSDTSARFKSWVNQFRFGNVEAVYRPKAVTPPVVIHESFDDFIFTPMKTFKRGAIWTMGVGSTVLVCAISLFCYLRVGCFREAVNFVAGGIVKAIWNLFPPTFKEKHETRRRDKKMERDLIRAQKLKNMIRNKKSLEALRKKRKTIRGEASKQENTEEGTIKPEPSAPFPEDVVLRPIPEESIVIHETQGAASFSKTA